MTESAMRRYIDFFESLDAEGVARLADVVTEDVHFVDPFNDVSGVDAARRVFEHMYSVFDSPRFRVTQAALVPGDGRTGLMRWELDAIGKRDRKPYRIIGMSEIRFAPDGRVREHVDHWDTGRQFYERLPVIGWVLRLIRGRLAV